MAFNGSRLEKRSKDTGFETKSAAAEFLGISPSQYNSLISGDRNPSFSLFERICLKTSIPAKNFSTLQLR